MSLCDNWDLSSPQHLKVALLLTSHSPKAALAIWRLLAARMVSQEKANIRIPIWPCNTGLDAMIMSKHPFILVIRSDSLLTELAEQMSVSNPEVLVARGNPLQGISLSQCMSICSCFHTYSISTTVTWRSQLKKTTPLLHLVLEWLTIPWCYKSNKKKSNQKKKKKNQSKKIVPGGSMSCIVKA